MTTEKMNVHKALAELKVLDSRIMNNISNSTFCATNKHSNKKIEGHTVEDYAELIKIDYQKITDLIRRRAAIKRAVVLSNAKTEVEIAGIKYTVAEAIEMKNHGMDFEKELLQEITLQYARCKTDLLNRNGDKLTDKAEQYVTGLFGAKEGKTVTEDFQKAMNDYIENNKFDFIDPINVAGQMECIKSFVDSFTSEVDAALSVSNAITEITVEY